MVSITVALVPTQHCKHEDLNMNTIHNTVDPRLSEPPLSIPRFRINEGRITEGLLYSYWEYIVYNFLQRVLADEMVRKAVTQMQAT